MSAARRGNVRPEIIVANFLDLICKFQFAKFLFAILPIIVFFLQHLLRIYIENITNEIHSALYKSIFTKRPKMCQK